MLPVLGRFVACEGGKHGEVYLSTTPAPTMIAYGDWWVLAGIDEERARYVNLTFFGDNQRWWL
jgi:hypothetical protein